MNVKTREKKKYCVYHVNICAWSSVLYKCHLLYYKKVNRVLKMKSFSYLRQVVNEKKTEITLRDGVKGRFEWIKRKYVLHSELLHV